MGISNQDWYLLGQQVRSFLVGLTAGPVIPPSSSSMTDEPVIYSPQTTPSNQSPSWQGSQGPNQSSDLPHENIIGQCNEAGVLRPGHLLITVLPSNCCYQVDPETGSITYLFELNWGPGTLLWHAVPDRRGYIYCTLSGIRTPPPVVDAEFGKWGGIVRVNHLDRDIRTIAERGQVIDPYGIDLTDDGRLLIADFADFGGTGSLYFIDLRSGELRVFAQGGRLIDPVSAVLDDDGSIWVANGDHNSQDGEVLHILPDGNQDVVVPRHGPNSGALLGVVRGPHKDQLIAVKNDWNSRVNSRVMLVNKHTKEVTNLLEASEDARKFFCTLPVVSGHNLWVVECCNKILMKYDILDRRVVKEFDLTPVMGGHRGMRNSFDGVPGVSIVPHNLEYS